MRIDVWSDVVCPWCFIGRRRLESAVRDLPDAEIVLHAFELDPNAPKVAEHDLNEMLKKKYGLHPDKVAEMQARVTSLAAAEGLNFRLDAARPENTFDAHRLIALGAEHGRQTAVVDAVMRAYFEEGRRVGDPVELGALGRAAGLPGDEVDRVVGDPTVYADAVRNDEAEARRLGIRGVPFFVFDGRVGVSGAQPAEVLRQAWDRARTPA